MPQDTVAIPDGVSEAPQAQQPQPAPATAPPKPVPIPEGVMPEQPRGVVSRSLEGIKQSLSSTVEPLRMVFTPPQDATEHAIAAIGNYTQAGPTSLAVYRLGKKIVDSAEAMLKAPSENFQLAQQDFARAVDEFHKKDYRNALASTASVVGDVNSLNMMDPGSTRIRELAEGTRPGANLATPLARDLTDLATLLVAEKAPEAAGKVGGWMEKNAPKVANGLLRANREKNFLYGKDPGKALLDARIKPTMNLEDLWTQLDDVGAQTHREIMQRLNDPRVAAEKIDIVPEVNRVTGDALSKIQKMRGLKNRQGIIDQINDMRDEMLGVYDKQGNILGRATRSQLSPGEVVEMRRTVGKSIQWDALETDPEIREYVNNVRKEMYATLNQQVEAAFSRVAHRWRLVDPNIKGVKELNADYSNNIEARRLLARRIAQEERNDIGLNRLLAKSEIFVGGVRMLAGDVVSGGALIGNRLMRSPVGRVWRAQFQNNLAPGLQGPVPRMVGRGVQADVAAGALSGPPQGREDAF